MGYLQNVSNCDGAMFGSEDMEEGVISGDSLPNKRSSPASPCQSESGDNGRRNMLLSLFENWSINDESRSPNTSSNEAESHPPAAVESARFEGVSMNAKCASLSTGHRSTGHCSPPVRR